jgi:hypothetical protein
MNASTHFKIAAAALTILGASIGTAYAGDQADFTKDQTYTANADGVSKANVKTDVLAILKNHENRHYHRLRTSTIHKVGSEWNISVKTLNGLKVATAVVNAETGKITFKQ